VNVRGALFEATADDLIHEAHHRGFLVLGFVEHGDFITQIFSAPVGPAAQDLLKRVRSETVELLQTFHDARALSDMPDDRHREAGGHTLMRHEAQRIKRGDVQRACDLVSSRLFVLRFFGENGQQAMTQRDLRRQQAAHPLLGRLLFILSAPTRAGRVFWPAPSGNRAHARLRSPAQHRQRRSD
jgi:hypothetical protein